MSINDYENKSKIQQTIAVSDYKIHEGIR